MGTYFPTQNNQTEAAAPMLYPRDSFPSSYSEAPVISGNMMMYMNCSASSGSCTDTLAGSSHVDASSSTPLQQEFLSNLGGSRIGEHDFHQWGNNINEMSFMHPMGGANCVLQGVQNLQCQGLSLSLSTQIPPPLQLPCIEYQNPNTGFSSFLSHNLSISGEGSGRSASFREDESSQNKQLRNAEFMPPRFLGGNSDSTRTDISPHGMPSIARTIPNSKYLKVGQQLLDEVVNVRKALKQQDCKKDPSKSFKEDDGESKTETNLPSASASNSPRELSAAERQDLQDKLTNLLPMLDEVDRRYRKYYHQMQIVVSSFDVVAGCGAAKPYTALALQTISRHFRCLRDAITGQIQVTRRSVGEQDGGSSNSKGVGISRLRYVDQHLRQQRTLQQLGMMQQHTWRPQRGLPESSVSILRAWLFEHFLHPYPKDSDKIMLARQTGLTRSQVTNWFINARVRLWKPMVEEIYKEEIGDADVDSNSSSEVAPRAIKSDIRASEDRGEDVQQSATSKAIEQRYTRQILDSKPDHAPDTAMVGTTIDATFRSVIQSESESEYEAMKSSGGQRISVDDSCFLPYTTVESSGGIGRFPATAAAYHHISELGRFGNGSRVSLTLGLQHCEGGGIPMSVETTHHGSVAMRDDDLYNTNKTTSSSVGPETADFDCMDSGNRQHRFGSSHLLLHDFVA